MRARTEGILLGILFGLLGVAWFAIAKFPASRNKR
jgi:hypothetical protein